MNKIYLYIILMLLTMYKYIDIATLDSSVDLYDTSIRCSKLLEAPADITDTVYKLQIPIIQDGKSYIRGSISDYEPKGKDVIRIITLNPITCEMDVAFIAISTSGHFEGDFPLYASTTGLFVSDYLVEYMLLTPRDTCIVDISINGNEQKSKHMVSFGGTYSHINEQLYALSFQSYCQNFLRNPSITFNTPLERKEYIYDVLSEALAELSQLGLSNETMELVTINLQQIAMQRLIDLSYLREQLAGKSTSFATLDYFYFLKDLDLNNPLIYYGRHYSSIISKCNKIEDELLNLSDYILKKSSTLMALSPKDIDDQKEYLRKILGVGTGPVFDLLILSNFKSKMNFDVPLEQWEINHLGKMDNPLYSNVFHHLNDELLARIEKNNVGDRSVMVDISEESTPESIERFISSYRGSPVFINYFGIGCIFAHNAIQAMESQKPRFIEDEVLFIYVSDDYTDYRTWTSVAGQIAGTHYRVNKSQKESLGSTYGLLIDSTPSFLILDKKGDVTYARVGYSPAIMDEIIEVLNNEID